MNKAFKGILLKAIPLSVVLTFIYFLLIQPHPIVQIPKLRTQDIFFKCRYLLAGPARLDDVVLIIVDDESIQKIRQKWPFRRAFYAGLVNEIAKQNPKVIGFDLVFSGKGEGGDDLILSEAIARAGNVAVASFVNNEGYYVEPLKELKESAKAVGIINKLTDSDHFVRRANLIYKGEDGRIIAWPWELDLTSLFQGKLHSEYLTQTPLIRDKEVRINYRLNLKDLNAISLARFLDQPNLIPIQGKMVLIGATSKVLHDFYQTPLGMMAGVVININLLNNLLHNDYLRTIPRFFDAAIFFIFVFVGFFLAYQMEIVKSLLLYGLATAGLFVFFLILFSFNFAGDFFSPFFIGWILFVATAFYRYFFTAVENVQLKGKVVTDPLTGLFNRRLLESKIEEELESLTNVKGGRKTDVRELSILMVDIDNFKKINDTYGHQFGDDVLKTVSFCIKENIRSEDLAARFGGEEFCVILVNTSKKDAFAVAEKIRQGIEQTQFNYVNSITHFTASIGLASAKEDRLFASRSLIRAADSALYEAKKNGKNQVCIYNITPLKQ